MKIAFVHQELQSFVRRDLDILRSAHDVRPIQFTSRKELASRFIPDLRELLQGVAWSDLTFSWFGKLHAFFTVLFSKILGKKAVVVSGGDDVERGEVGGRPYGLTATLPGRLAARITFGLADLVLSVSHFNRDQALANVGIDPGKIVVIYHGFDGDTFRKVPYVQKEPLVLTVGYVTAENYYRKGLKLFLETARLLADVPFYLVGTPVDDTFHALKHESPSNAIITGHLSQEELLILMSRAVAYVQVSEWESFGCSLAEAMLCECIPVVSRRTALPEVVGDCGFYVDRLEPEALAEKIKEALQAPVELGKEARQRIVDYFPLEDRRRNLLAAVASLDGK